MDPHTLYFLLMHSGKKGVDYWAWKFCQSVMRQYFGKIQIYFEIHSGPIRVIKIHTLNLDLHTLDHLLMHSGKKGVNYLARKFANILGGPLSDTPCLIHSGKKGCWFLPQYYGTVIRQKKLAFVIHIIHWTTSWCTVAKRVAIIWQENFAKVLFDNIVTKKNLFEGIKTLVS